ncbi:MAG: DegV family protein [Lachnospiraceae bacterium]|nr:DegV family protein [Lachnospiraceae bacterium]
MNYKIVADSSSNLFNLEEVNYESVPLHIIVGDRDFVDVEGLNLDEMQECLSSYSGKSSTSCPSSQEWMDAFGDAEAVFCVTITSNLSGACGSAKAAADMYESEYPDRKVYVIDSLSTGPEMVLIIEKLVELIKSGMDANTVYEKIRDYQKKTHLYFVLSSLDNFAKNGRINPIIAKGIGILGIKIVGKASHEGTLKPMDKCRGDIRAYSCLTSHLKKCGYNNGRIIISHTNNPSGAVAMNDFIKKELNFNDAIIMENRGLCSYYAEPGSILIGFEA